MKRFLFASAAALLLGLAPSAQAYTAYMKPSEFSPQSESGAVTVELAFGTQFFQPQIGLAAQTAFAKRPDGMALGFSSVRVSATKSEFDVTLREPGTYRFSSGVQLGAVTRMALIDGDWRPVAADYVPPPPPPPEPGADPAAAPPAPPTPEDLVRTLQTVTVAETYVSRGYPRMAGVEATVGRLSIKPITHPNLVSVAGGFDVQLLFDGQPFANFPFVLYAAGDAETKLDRTFVTDAQGMARIIVEAPGAYMVLARHRTDAPAGAQAQVQSYTTSLTFEALSALPPEPPPPPPERRRRRNR